MTLGYWLRISTGFLQTKSIATARLDCLVLLEDVLKTDRARLLAEPQRELTDAQVGYLKKLLTRRARHEPLAYIRGRTEFYGRSFLLTPGVLEPRPESETMIDILKDLCAKPWSTDSKAAGKNEPADQYAREPKIITLADVGAGSGALGITAVLEVPNTRVELLEIDEIPLKNAKRNVDLFTLNISVIKSDLLAQSAQNYDILLCNLPYVPDMHTINQAAMHEPKNAIFGGPDGLYLYRKLFAQLQNAAQRPLYILTEALPPQHTALAEIAAKAGYKHIKTDDFIQVFAQALTH